MLNKRTTYLDSCGISQDRDVDLASGCVHAVARANHARGKLDEAALG